MQIFVNRDIAAKMGLKVNDIAKIINTSFAGYKATTITPKNSDWNDIDVTVQLENSDKVTIEDIKKISVPVKEVLIPLSSIADIVKSYGPRIIERKDRKRVTTVYANISEKPLNEVMAEIKYKMNNQIFIPAGISINYAGDFEDMNEAFNQLILALILALVLAPKLISVFSDADKLAKLFKLLIAENDAIGIGIKRIPTPIINPALDAADPTPTRPATAADSPYTSL